MNEVISQPVHLSHLPPESLLICVDGHCNRLFVRVPAYEMTVQAFFPFRAVDLNAKDLHLRASLSGTVDAPNALQLSARIGDRVVRGATVPDIQGRENDEVVTFRLQVETCGVFEMQKENAGSLLVGLGCVTVLVP